MRSSSWQSNSNHRQVRPRGMGRGIYIILWTTSHSQDSKQAPGYCRDGREVWEA